MNKKISNSKIKKNEMSKWNYCNECGTPMPITDLTKSVRGNEYFCFFCSEKNTCCKCGQVYTKEE